ncbi:MAG: hypothetical protein IPK82_41515 [Polyangiaceae bacterium]|nr:hypothetical protein [Polyangiaceae bacterium]
MTAQKPVLPQDDATDDGWDVPEEAASVPAPTAKTPPPPLAKPFQAPPAPARTATPKPAAVTVPAAPQRPAAKPAPADESEAVSLREIESLVSPGKAPPRLPSSPSARLSPSVSRGLGRAPEPNVSRPIAPRHEALADVPPPSTVERALPNPLESTAADLELMAALAPVPSKRPAHDPPAWSAPKAPVQARSSTVAVLSPDAVAALKGTKQAPSGWRTPTAPQRAPTLRSHAVSVERPAPAARANPPVAVDDNAWGNDAEQGRRISTLPTPPAPDRRAMDALHLRGQGRGSLPDPAELLRDGVEHSDQPTGRGSVVDPLELYGAATPRPAVPEQNLPKVMVQVPTGHAARALAESGEKTAAKIGASETRTAAALAEAEARAAAVAAEANAAFRPRVDLPTRAEPKPFPKPPPRKVGPSKLGHTDASDAGVHIATRDNAAPETTKPTPIIKVPPLPVPAAPKLEAKAASSLRALTDSEPESVEPVLAEDEIPVDITPDPPEGEPTKPPSGGPNSDSGRFDLQQLMATGPKSSKKGLADADLFTLANDLFSDSNAGAPNLAPPDLRALAKSASTPPPSARLLAPVAVGTAPETAPPRILSAPPPTESIHPSPLRSRSLVPWMLLPLVALAAAALMIWRGRATEPTKEAAAASASNTAPEPPSRKGDVESAPTTTKAETAPKEAPTGTTSSAASEPGEKPKNGDANNGTNSAWKPPPGSTTNGAQTATTASTPPTAPSAPPTATAPAVASTPAPTTSAPAAAAGNEFNASAAKAALRTAAGSAAGCASDKPGVATVQITFAPSGRVTSSQVSGAFAGTTTGGCIASAMRGATVPPFEGGPVSVVWKVTLR